MSRLFQRFRQDIEGATAIEYALIASFIAMVIVSALTQVGTELIGIFEAVLAGFN